MYSKLDDNLTSAHVKAGRKIYQAMQRLKKTARKSISKKRESSNKMLIRIISRSSVNYPESPTRIIEEEMNSMIHDRPANNQGEDMQLDELERILEEEKHEEETKSDYMR